MSKQNQWVSEKHMNTDENGGIGSDEWNKWRVV